MTGKAKQGPQCTFTAEREALMLDSAHFRLLTDRFDQISHAIHDLECSLEGSSPRLAALNQQRVALIAEIDELIGRRG